MKHTTPIISVIVPMHNSEKHLRQCITSILTQTIENIELLLVDDGSTDSTIAICNEIAATDPRVHILHTTTPRSGISAARNVGINNARGEWISHVDADDWLNDMFLECMLQQCEDVGADIAFCKIAYDFIALDITKYNFDWYRKGYLGLSDFISLPWAEITGSMQRRSLYTEHHLQSPTNIAHGAGFHLIVRLCYYARKATRVHCFIYHSRRQQAFMERILHPQVHPDELWAYDDIARFFKSQGIYYIFERAMAWRFIKASQAYAYNAATLNEFRAYHPEKRAHIFGCTFISPTDQLHMWCLTHHLTLLSLIYLKFRTKLVKKRHTPINPYKLIWVRLFAKKPKNK